MKTFNDITLILDRVRHLTPTDKLIGESLELAEVLVKGDLLRSKPENLYNINIQKLISDLSIKYGYESFCRHLVELYNLPPVVEKTEEERAFECLSAIINSSVPNDKKESTERFIHAIELALDIINIRKEKDNL